MIGGEGHFFTLLRTYAFLYILLQSCSATGFLFELALWFSDSSSFAHYIEAWEGGFWGFLVAQNVTQLKKPPQRYCQMHTT